MDNYLHNSSEISREIKQVIPTYAAAFEARVFELSEKYIFMLWFHKRARQGENRRQDLSNLPPFIDPLIRGIFAGMDQQLDLKDDKSIVKAYVDDRDELNRQNLPDVTGLIKYLDYDDLVTYLDFFTTNTIEETLKFGKSLAKRTMKPPGMRMDGTPIPKYPQ